MDEKSANAMQKDLYDTAGFWKYMCRVESLTDQMVLKIITQRIKDHLGKLEAMLEEALLKAKVDEEIARREA